MASDIRVKICGLREPVHVDAAVAAGAAYVGFVLFPKSPRYVDLQTARALTDSVPPGVAKVALTVNATDAELDTLTETVPLDMLQLHGNETLERVQAVKARYGLPVMKALGIATAEDLPQIDAYAGVADQLLIDAKPPKGADRPGGNAVTFDWNLIAGRRWTVPWMLAGGLTADNVVEAIRRTGARQVDLSSALETAPGVKDVGLIQSFIKVVQCA